MQPHDKARFVHIRDAAQAAIDFAEGESLESVKNDLKLAFALARALEIIGEAAVKVSAETQENYPEVPWSSMIGMRNKIIHDYVDVDAEIVWQTVQTDLPALLEIVDMILAADKTSDL